MRKNTDYYTKKVNPEDIKAGDKLVQEFKKWTEKGGNGYGISQH